MDIYKLIAEWIGWPAVSALLLLAIGAVIWMLEHQLSIKEDIIDNLKSNSPDVLLQNLKARLDIATNLLDAEGKDKAKAHADLKQALDEISRLKDEINKLKANYSLYASTAESMEAVLGGTISALPPKKVLVKEYPELKTITIKPELLRQWGKVNANSLTAVDMKKLRASVDRQMDLVSKSAEIKGL